MHNPLLALQEVTRITTEMALKVKLRRFLHREMARLSSTTLSSAWNVNYDTPNLQSRTPRTIHQLHLLRAPSSHVDLQRQTVVPVMAPVEDIECTRNNSTHICGTESPHTSLVGPPRQRPTPRIRQNPRMQRKAVTARSLLVEASCLDILLAGSVLRAQGALPAGSSDWVVKSDGRSACMIPSPLQTSIPAHAA